MSEKNKEYLILKTMLFSNYLKYIEKNKEFSSKITQSKILECLKNSNINKKTIGKIKKIISSGKISFGQNFDLLVNSQDLEAMIIYDGPDLFIGFNSTEIGLQPGEIIDTIKDIKTFFDLELKIISDNKKIKVHSGYYDILFFENIIEKIINKIMGLNEKKIIKNIYIIGHSAGGTIASICSYILTEKFKENNFYLYPTGYVKPGNHNFIKHLYNIPNLVICPIINKNDIVPILPPLPDYKNFNKNKLLRSKIKIISGEKINLANNNSIIDHYQSSYIENFTYIITKK